MRCRCIRIFENSCRPFARVQVVRECCARRRPLEPKSAVIFAASLSSSQDLGERYRSSLCVHLATDRQRLRSKSGPFPAGELTNNHFRWQQLTVRAIEKSSAQSSSFRLARRDLDVWKVLVLIHSRSYSRLAFYNGFFLIKSKMMNNKPFLASEENEELRANLGCSARRTGRSRTCRKLNRRPTNRPTNFLRRRSSLLLDTRLARRCAQYFAPS